MEQKNFQIGMKIPSFSCVILGCILLVPLRSIAPALTNFTLGFCGDGICRSPEFADSCSSDCGEIIRNWRMLSRESGSFPFFWRPNEGSFADMSRGRSVELVMNVGDMISQSGVSVLPLFEYILNLNVSKPACLEVFVHSISSVFLAVTNISRVEWTSPQSEQELTLSLRSVCVGTVLWSVSLLPKPVSTNVGWKYYDIVDSIIGIPSRVSSSVCEASCLAEGQCCAWQVCPGSESEGCLGCYLLGRSPESSSADIKIGWNAAIVRSVPNVDDHLNVHSCRKWFMSQSSHETDFYDSNSGKLQKYLDCGRIIRGDKLLGKQLFMAGVHIPTIVVVNHRTPNPQALGVHQGSPPYAFILPFYDTNIGNVIKHTSSMNIVQSYEMQALVEPGDVFIDVGANLGSYTVPLAERVGPTGKVIAFEPFRWMYQLLNANVAVNGLMNCWLFQVALSDVYQSGISLLQPNLRQFSSPGGMKVDSQQGGQQLYDNEWGPEPGDTWKLDDILPTLANRVDLIKIDVEGMETKVVVGAVNSLAKFRPIIWSENVDWFESKNATFINQMVKIGYKCWQSTHAGNDLICEPNDGSRSDRIAKVGHAQLDIQQDTGTTC